MAKLITCHAVLLACAALSTLLFAQPARAVNSPAITVSEPDGFESLTRDRQLLVDVYFGGARVGEAMITTTPDTVAFADPAAVLALMPPLVDPQAVAMLLSDQALPANAQLVCTPGSDKMRCGTLAPDTVGVILDKDRFRVDVFLNPRFLATDARLEDRYIPSPDANLSLINSIGGVLSGQAGGGDSYYSLQDQLIAAWGDKRLRADLAVASGFGFQAERLAFEWDQPERRYSAGAIWSPGDGLTGRQKLLGFGIETQIDTRRDRELLLGSPIVVFLDRRARVDILHRGRVLSSAVYEAGNRLIDTSSLPEGSYEIVLRIEEVGQGPREERRFYTKSRRVPSLGRTDFFAYGGLLMKHHDPGTLNVSSSPYIQAGVAHRIAQSWALDTSLQASVDYASAELGLSILSPFAQARAAAVAETSGNVGALLQLSSSANRALNFNIDLRHFVGSGTDAGDPSPAVDLSHPTNPLRFARAPDRSYSQAGGVISYSVANFRLLGVAQYRDEEGLRAQYSVGPAVEWDVLRLSDFVVTLRGDFNATEIGRSGFAGISLRFLGSRSSVTALAGARSTSTPDDGLGDGIVGALAGSWNTEALDGELALGAGYEHQPKFNSAVVSSEFQHTIGSLSGDFVRSDQAGMATTQYSVGFQTAFAASSAGLHVAGKTTTDSMVVARVKGASGDESFEVLVDDQVVAIARGDKPTVVKLPSYRTYGVRIRPIGSALLAYDGSVRELGLFPGVVADLEWSAAPLIIKIGRLVDDSGNPVAGASIMGKGVWGQTDQSGYFQIEAPDHAELDVILPNGRRVGLTLPQGITRAGITRLGSVACCEARDVMLSVVDRSAIGDGTN